MKYRTSLDSLKKLYDNIIQRRESKKTSYIHFSFRLIPQKAVQFVSEKLVFLFKKKTMIIVFSISFFTTLIFYFFILRHNLLILNNWMDIVLTYVILLLILIFHEFGHASASMSMNIKPGEIGFGFYLIFPVLYANVTNIWILNKIKRIIINLGGIYFQIIANALLVGAYFLYPSDIFLRVISINSFVCLVTIKK
jgi:putative peptide zinc metalloprotease protein